MTERPFVWQNDAIAPTAEDIKNCKIYLTKHGIPRQMVERIMKMFIGHALEESNSMKYDRIYAAIALAAHRTFGFGPKRILRMMHAFDDLAMYIMENDQGYDWVTLMEECRNETGFVVRTNEENRIIFEYVGTDLADAKEVEVDA